MTTIASTATSTSRLRLRRRLMVWSARIALLFAFGLIWRGLTAFHIEKPFFVGDPIGMLHAFMRIFGGSIATVDLPTTLKETFIGFGIGTGGGVAVGMVLALSPILRDTFQPLFTAMNSLPRPALAPLFILWFGIGPLSKIALAISLVFFIMVSTTVAALTTRDRDLELLGRSLGASPLESLRFLVLPGAVPSLWAGLELGLIYSLLAAVVGEMLGGVHGLGVVLQADANTFATNDLLAVLLLLAILASLFVHALNLIARYLMRWHQAELSGLESTLIGRR